MVSVSLLWAYAAMLPPPLLDSTRNSTLNSTRSKLMTAAEVQLHVS